MQKMKLIKKIRQLEKKGIFSREPHPIVPFAMAILAFLLGIYSFNINEFFANIFLYLAAFTFVFAILHWAVWEITK